MRDLRVVGRRIARSTLLRASISIGLLAAVLSQVDLAAIGRRLGSGHWALFPVAVGVLVTALVLGGARWHRFLAAAGVPTSRVEALKAFFAASFVSNFLPAAVGGDVVRGWVGARAGYRTRAYASIIIDRVTVVTCAFVLAWAAVVIADDTPGASVRTLFVATLLLAVALALTWLAVRGGPSSVLAALVPRRLEPTARELRRGLRLSLALPVLFSTALSGVGYQLLMLTTTWLLGRAVNVDVAFTTFAIVLPSVLVLSSIPVSLGGLGVRELAFVALLAPFGVSATDATLVALMTGATYALGTTPGAVTLLLDRRSRPQGAEPT